MDGAETPDCYRDPILADQDFFTFFFLINKVPCISHLQAMKCQCRIGCLIFFWPFTVKALKLKKCVSISLRATIASIPSIIKRKKKEKNSQEVCIHAYRFFTYRLHSPIEDASYYIISHFRFYKRERKI